jgi:site-specific recombinase XerC
MAHLVRVWRPRWYLDGKRVPAQTPGAEKIRAQDPRWYAAGPPLPPKKRIPLARNRTVAVTLLGQLVERLERGEAGLEDSYSRARRRPLAEHLDDWEREMGSSGTSAKQVRQTAARCRTILAAAGADRIDALSPSRVQEAVADLRRDRTVELPARESWTKAELCAALGVKPPALLKRLAKHRLAAVGSGRARRYPHATALALAQLFGRGVSIQTANFYLQAVKQFTAWLVADRRLRECPLTRLAGGNVRTDRRHDRRDVSPAELVRLLEACRLSVRSWRGLAGPDRLVLYVTTFGTGFRRAEVAALTPAWFDLAGQPPTVRLPARLEKAGRGARQVLPAGLVVLLREYLAGRPPGAPVWPGGWHERAADMLQADLEEAGVPYRVEGPDGPLFADFHALRHTYITAGDRAGLTVKERQELARHTDPRLTLGRYSHAGLEQLGRAADRLDLPGLSGPAAIPTEVLLALGALAWEVLGVLLGPGAPRK